MSLPPQLRASLTPVELEFIACSHETIEIVPLFSMDRVRLISVSTAPQICLAPWTLTLLVHDEMHPGCIWPFRSAYKDPRSTLASSKLEAENEVPNNSTKLAFRWCER